MAVLKQTSWKFDLSPVVTFSLGYEAGMSDTITFTETVFEIVSQTLADDLRSGKAIWSDEIWNVQLEVADEMFLEEGVDGRAKGGIKTLYITDERYIKFAGS